MASPPQKAKKRSMSRSNSGGFFACFRPAVDERVVTAYISFDDGKEVNILPGIIPCQMGCKGEVDDRLPKDGGHKRFARATKAVFLGMSLVKKVQKKRKSKKTEEPNEDLFKKADRILKRKSKKTEEPNEDPFKKADRILRLMSLGSTAGKNDSCENSTRSDSDVSISSHSSTAATSLYWTGSNRLLSPDESCSNSVDAGAAKLFSSNISSEPKRIAQDRSVVVPARRFTSVADGPMCLILLILAVLVFWGKVCAIVFTSTCLVVAVPNRTPRRGSSESIDSAEYKKRIIMEGLLQRQRPRALLQLPSSR